MAGGKHNDNWDRSFPNNYGDYSPEQESIRQWHEELANRKLDNDQWEENVYGDPNDINSPEYKSSEIVFVLSEDDITRLHGMGIDGAK